MSDGGPKAEAPTGGSEYVGYRCYLMGALGNIRRRIELAATDDDSAIVKAQVELETSSFGIAEVWFLSRKIRTIMKADDR